MPRSKLTESIKRVEAMVSYVQENLSTEEYDLFLDKVAPEPEPQESKPKKTRKKRQAKTEKRAPLGDQLSLAKGSDGSKSNEPMCGACGNAKDYADHFKPSPHYHEFQAGKKEKSAAP